MDTSPPPAWTQGGTQVNSGRLVLATIAGVISLPAAVATPFLIASGLVAGGLVMALIAVTSGAGGYVAFRRAIRRPPNVTRRSWSSVNYFRAEPVLFVGLLLVLVVAVAVAGLRFILALLVGVPMLAGGVGALHRQRVWEMLIGPAMLAAVVLVLGSAALQTESNVVALLVIGAAVFALAAALVGLGYSLGRVARRLAFALKPAVAGPVLVEATLGRELWGATDHLRAPFIERVYPASGLGARERDREQHVLADAGYALVDQRNEARNWPDGDEILIVTFARTRDLHQTQ